MYLAQPHLCCSNGIITGNKIIKNICCQRQCSILSGTTHLGSEIFLLVRMADPALCMIIIFTGKILIIGGGIANFTNVSATFKVNLTKVSDFLLYF